VFPFARSFSRLACSPRLIYTLFHATYSFRSALKMEAAPSYETLVAVPVYTALLVASSTLSWELQTGNTSINLPLLWLCTLQYCKVQDILEDSSFSGYDTVSSAVTEISEELTCSIFRVQSKKHNTFLQSAIILGTGNLVAKLGTAVHIDAWGIFHCRLSLRSGSVHKCSQICNITKNRQK